MTKIIILGAGAAPGVPSLSIGWGSCDCNNPKNYRQRTSTYYDFSGTKIVIDTSPEMLWGLKKNNLRSLDGVLYSHLHADHLHGIDDLREINRIKGSGLDIFATDETMRDIEKRFGYLLAVGDKRYDAIYQAHLIPNKIEHNKTFYINDLKIMPIKLTGHIIPSTGYVFNDGEVVHIADFKSINDEALTEIKVRPKLLVLPLTTPKEHRYHASLEEVLAVIARINPQKAVLNHLSSECDYEEILGSTPENVEPAYDNMIIEV